MTDIPKWARAEALKRFIAENGSVDWSMQNDSYNAAITVLARLIAKHEQPPADPDLATAREAVARHNEASEFPSMAAIIRDGNEDDCSEVQLALAAIKLHKERNP